MQCDHQIITSYLTDYMEGHLSGELRRQCEAALDHCPVCRSTHEQALGFARLAHEWETQSVPNWQRTRFAVRPQRQQYSWLNWGALATSCFTLLLVLFQVEVSTDNGLLISFGGSQQEQRIQEELGKQLEQFRVARAENIAEQLAEFGSGQDTANRLHLSDWLERSRTERRQDMEFLMTTWESQRFQDRQRTDERLSYLARNQIESDQYLSELLQNSAYAEGGPL